MALGSIINPLARGSVLSSIANPPTVNPLAAVQAANTTAEQTWRLRGVQAQQRLGELAQQAIDPTTKQFDPARFNALVAGAGPDVSLGAQAAMQNASTLSGTQLKQTAEKVAWYNGAAGSLPDNATRDDINRVIRNGVASGYLTPTDAANEASQIPPNDADLPEYVQQHRLRAMDAASRMGYRYGAGGLTAGQLSTEFTYLDPSTNQPQKTTVGEFLRSRGLLPQAAPPPPAGSAVPQPSGTSTAPAPPLPKPGTRLGSGAYPTPSAAPPPAPPPAAAPTPAPAAPATPPPMRSVPTGIGPQTQKDIDAYNVATTAVPDQKRNITAGETALQALDLASSGPGTANVNAVKSFMIAQGIPGWQELDTGSAEAYQIARKNMLRFAQAQGGKIGTDLGLATQLESNVNIETLLKGANRHILVQDLGLARQRLAQTLTAPAGGTGQTEFGNGMAEHVKNFTPQTDYHAFSWDLMTPEERGAYLQSIENNKDAHDRFDRSMRIAKQSGVWSSLNAGR